LSEYLTQTFMTHCNEMIYQQVTLLGYAEWPKVADAVIEAEFPILHASARMETPSYCDSAVERRLRVIIAYSGRKLPLIPVEPCHRFQSKAATDSD
jgi:hypothetical protein